MQVTQVQIRVVSCCQYYIYYVTTQIDVAVNGGHVKGVMRLISRVLSRA